MSNHVKDNFSYKKSTVILGNTIIIVQTSRHFRRHLMADRNNELPPPRHPFTEATLGARMYLRLVLEYILTIGFPHGQPLPLPGTNRPCSCGCCHNLRPRLMRQDARADQNLNANIDALFQEGIISPDEHNAWRTSGLQPPYMVFCPNGEPHPHEADHFDVGHWIWMTPCGRMMADADLRDAFPRLPLLPDAVPVPEAPEDTGGGAGAQAASAPPVAQAASAPPAGAGRNPDNEEDSPPYGKD